MKIKELFEKKRFVFSFEIFPPKPTTPLERIYNTLDELKGLKPDFISVTYGAGGSTRDRTSQIAIDVKNNYGIESLAHLTCIEATREETCDLINFLIGNGVHNILALRGDLPQGQSAPKGDFRHAVDLVSFLREKYGQAISIGGAAYPEGHIECEDPIKDLRYLKQKVDAGVDFLITQLFFDNELFYRFMERADIAGINVPISAGIMPVVNKNQIERIVTLCGASLPQKFVRILHRYADEPRSLEEAGIAYATDQIVDLIAFGVRGIHLYTMNKAHVARRIVSNVSTLRETMHGPKGEEALYEGR